MRCYYDDPECNYHRGLWQCKSCLCWFCYTHNHSTCLGDNVECVVCERVRIEGDDDHGECEPGIGSSDGFSRAINPYIKDEYPNE